MKNSDSTHAPCLSMISSCWKHSSGKVIWNGTYFSLSNVASNKVFNLRNGNTADGTLIQATTADKSNAQYFYFTPTNLLANGSYRLLSGLGTTTLSVKGASGANGANVQANGKTGSVSQLFTLSATGTTNSTYYLTNVNSGKVVAVKDAATTAGANVIQSTKTGAKSQQWIAQIADGGYVRFVNANSGKILAVAGNNTRAGANVQQNSARAVNGQKWKPAPTGWNLANGKYDFYDLDGKKTTWTRSTYVSWNRIKNMSSGTKYLGAIDKEHTYTSFYIRQDNLWVPCQAWLCSVGRYETPTPSGTFKVLRKLKYLLHEEYAGVWYWTIFNTAAQGIHSVLCHPGTKSPLWSSLGNHNSMGCVRSPLDKAYWTYINVGKGSTIHIY